MKLLKYIFIFSVVLTSCKSTKNTTFDVKKLTIKKLIKKHKKANFDKKTIDAKLAVNYKTKNENLSFSTRMKIKKDEFIYLKGSKFITVFKAKITPEKVSFYSPFKKVYFEGDFSMLKKILGVEVNFYQLQNMLLGNSLLPIDKNYSVEQEGYNYKVFPKKQHHLYKFLSFLNPLHFKANKQIIENDLGKLSIVYPDYISKENVLFPKAIILNGKRKNQETKVKIQVKSINFDKKLSLKYQIPSGYKKIKL